MKMLLINQHFRSDGIFGTLCDESGLRVAYTIQHAYENPNASPGDYAWIPKIPPGTYTCKRGIHKLHKKSQEFETFEITGVEGHTGLLFHPGNKNDDTEGCVCPGEWLIEDEKCWKVMNSRESFQSIMTLQEGINEFPLTVE